MTPSDPEVRGSEQRTTDHGPRTKWFKAPEWGLVAGILAVLALIFVLDRDHAFFQQYSLQTLFHRVALFGVLAVGAALVIIAGGIDLSTGAVVALVVGRQRQAPDRVAPAGDDRGESPVDRDRRRGDRDHAADGPGDRAVPRRS